MPVQTGVSTENALDRKPGIAGETLRLIAIGVMASVITGVIQFIAIRHIERSLQVEKEKRLLNLQGVRLLETHNRSAAMTKYQDLQIQYMAVISVDDNFNVHGTAYKVREKNDDPDSEKEYRREERTKSRLEGTLIQDRLTLLFDTQNAQGLPSFQSIDAVFRIASNEPRINGSFADEVGSQTGDVCGLKLLDAKSNGKNWFPCN